MPEIKSLPTVNNPQMLVYFYVPPAKTPPAGTPVVFFGGEWGWKPLQQDAASHLAAEGRFVLGVDSSAYFTAVMKQEIMATEFGLFRSYVNGRAGRAKEQPVILVGFAAGADIIPYMLNRIGQAGVRGIVLLAPPRTGATIFRVSMQLKMSSPPEESFDMEEELRRLPLIPVVFMDGTLDDRSAAKALSEVVRGPHRYAPVVGGDHQFHEAREPFFKLLSEGLRWIDSGAPAFTPAGKPVPGALPTPARGAQPAPQQPVAPTSPAPAVSPTPSRP